MRFADTPIQKLANTAYISENGTEIFFISERLAGKKIAEKFPSYKILFISEEAGRMSFLSCLPYDAVSFLWREPYDARELFSFPDDIALAVVCGGAKAICGARYFATLRGISLAVLCDEACAEGLFGDEAKVNILGEEILYPAKNPDVVFFDAARIKKDSVKSAFVTLAFRSLALLEKKFGRLIFDGEDSFYEEAFENYLSLTDSASAAVPAEEVFTQSFRSEILKNKGFYDTESSFLCDFLGEREKLNAFFKLADLFALILRYGRMRKIATPDYALRFLRAAELMGESEYYISSRCHIPTFEELKKYDIKLYKNREELLTFSERIRRRKQNILDTYCRFGGINALPAVCNEIFLLPELSGKYGIISLARDFGLFER